MQRTLSIALWLTLATTALSQTVTVPDPDGSGNSIVEVITVDPVQGLPTTSIIGTIPPGAAAPAAPVTTADGAGDPNQQGPVAAPPVTNTAPPTLIYTYTTTGAAGDLETFTQVFVPSYAAPNPTTPLSSGSIWDINQYTKSFGSSPSTKTGTSSASSLRTGTWSSSFGALVCTLASVATGRLLAVI